MSATTKGNCEEGLPKQTVGKLSADRLPISYHQATDSRPAVGRESAESRPTVGQQSVNSRLTVGQQSADGQPTGCFGYYSLHHPVKAGVIVCCSHGSLKFPNLDPVVISRYE